MTKEGYPPEKRKKVERAKEKYESAHAKVEHENKLKTLAREIIEKGTERVSQEAGEERDQEIIQEAASRLVIKVPMSAYGGSQQSIDRGIKLSAGRRLEKAEGRPEAIKLYKRHEELKMEAEEARKALDDSNSKDRGH